MPFSLGNMLAAMPAAYQGAQQVQEQPYRMQALQDEQQARQQSLEMNKMKLQSLADASDIAKQEQTRFGELMKDESFVGPDGKPMSPEVKSLAAARQAAIDAKDPDKVLAIDAARDNAEYKAAIGAKMKAEAMQIKTEQGVQDISAILKADGDPAVVDNVINAAVTNGRATPDAASALKAQLKYGLDGKLTPQSKALLQSHIDRSLKITDQIKAQKDAADRALREREVAARELDAKTREQKEARSVAGGKEGKVDKKQINPAGAFTVSGDTETFKKPGGEVLTPKTPEEKEMIANMNQPERDPGVYGQRSNLAMTDAAKQLIGLTQSYGSFLKTGKPGTLGVFAGLKGDSFTGALSSDLTRRATGEREQMYKALVSPIPQIVTTLQKGGYQANAANLQATYDSIVSKADVPEIVKLQQIGELSQQARLALESLSTSPTFNQGQRAAIFEAHRAMSEAIPFTQTDVINYNSYVKEKGAAPTMKGLTSFINKTKAPVEKHPVQESADSYFKSMGL